MPCEQLPTDRREAGEMLPFWPDLFFAYSLFNFRGNLEVVQLITGNSIWQRSVEVEGSR